MFIHNHNDFNFQKHENKFDSGSPRVLNSPIQKKLEESHYEFHGEAPKQKYRIHMAEAMLHSIEVSLGDNDSQGGAMGSMMEEGGQSHVMQKNSTTVIDIPLLVTMAAWFVMLYVGITKFIAANTIHNESYNKYLRGMSGNDDDCASQ